MDREGVVPRHEGQRWAVSVETLIGIPKVPPPDVLRQVLWRGESPTLRDQAVPGHDLLTVYESRVVGQTPRLTEISNVHQRLARRYVRLESSKPIGGMRRGWPLKFAG